MAWKKSFSNFQAGPVFIYSFILNVTFNYVILRKCCFMLTFCEVSLDLKQLQTLKYIGYARIHKSTFSCKPLVITVRVLLLNSLKAWCALWDYLQYSIAYLKSPTCSGCSLPLISATVLNESTSGSVWAAIVRRTTILWPLWAILAIIWASSIVMQAVGIWTTPGWYHCQPVWGLKTTPHVG